MKNNYIPLFIKDKFTSFVKLISLILLTLTLFISNKFLEKERRLSNKKLYQYEEE